MTNGSCLIVRGRLGRLRPDMTKLNVEQLRLRFIPSLKTDQRRLRPTGSFGDLN